MTEKVKKKRDELAEEYCVRPLPEALKNDLIRYKPDNLKIIQRLEYAAYKHGFDAGYQVAMDEMRNDYEKLHDLKCPICFKNFWWSFAKETFQERYWKAQAERIKTESEDD